MQSTCLPKLCLLCRLPFKWANKSLLWHPFQFVEWKATSVTAAELYGTVIPSNLLFLWIQLLFIHKTHTLSILFSNCHGKKLACFYEPNLGGSHQTFHFQILYSKLSKSVEFNLPSYLSQIVNFNGLTFLTALVVFNQITLLSHSNKDSDWLTIVCFMSVKHVDDTCVCF